MQNSGTAFEERPALGAALMVFERGEMEFRLHRRGGGFVWRADTKEVGGVFATPAEAKRFLILLGRLHNSVLDRRMR